MKSSPASSLISSSSRAISWANEPERLASGARSTFTPVRSISASTGAIGRSSVSYTVVTCSAASRGFSTSQSRKPDIGLLARIFGGARDGHEVERHRGAAASQDLLLGEAGMAEQAARELLGQMLGAAGVERVGHEAGVVDALKRDAVAGQRHHVELGVLHDLQDAGVLEKGLKQVERLRACPSAR